MSMLFKNPFVSFCKSRPLFIYSFYDYYCFIYLFIYLFYFYCFFFFRSVRLSILQHVKWTTVDKRSVIPDISMETLKVGNTSRLLSRK